METTLYDLLHNRGLRLNYFRDQSVLSNEWRNISTERVRKTANQILLQNHRELKARFANLYQEWAQRFSFDQIDNSGLELSANFLESDYYKNSKYLTKDNPSSISISGDYVIIGFFSPYQAKIYKRDITGFWLVQKFTQPNADGTERFGSSVAIDGSSKRFIVGTNSEVFSKVYFGKVK